MLVLSRKAREVIHIDGRIKITVVKISRNHVKVGVEAPSHVSIVRGELNEWDDLSFEQSGKQNRSGRQCIHATL